MTRAEIRFQQQQAHQAAVAHEAERRAERTAQRSSEQVRIIKVNTTVPFMNRYSVECSKCGGVQGVKNEREAKATAKGHAKICVEPKHQPRDWRADQLGYAQSICGGTNGVLVDSIWDVSCAACIARRAEVR